MATAQDILKICAKQVGVKESPANSNNVKYNTWFYGHAVSGSNYSWCSVFLDWCFEKAGAGKLYPHNAVTTAQDGIVSSCGGKWIMKKNKSSSTRKKSLSKFKPGDIVTFDFGAYDAWRDHIGIIRSVNTKNGTVQCYEGNTSSDDRGSQSNGGMVCLKTRSYSDICAVVRPAYDVKKPADSNDNKNDEVKNTVDDKLPKVTINGTKINYDAVDVSAWQGKITYNNWCKVKKDGYKIAILRTSYTTHNGFNLYQDKVFVHNIKTAIAAGLKIGVYHYSQATSVAEAKKEAKHLLSIISPYKDYITEQIVFDDEFGGRWNAAKANRLGKVKATKRCTAFCELVKKAGFEPMVYANYYMLTHYLDSASLKKQYKIWLAQYASSTSFKGMYMWQYSSSGRVKGLSGHIDVNHVYGKTKKIVLNDPSGVKYKRDLPNNCELSRRRGGIVNVKLWQSFINWCFGSNVLVVDGEFGNVTEEYTLKFQDAFGLEPDGVVGPKTLGIAKRIRK